MANADRWTTFHLYYWGQDRLGGWPYTLAWLLRQLTRVGWTVDRLHWLHGLIALSATWPLFRLGKEWGAALAACYLATLCLVPEIRGFIFDIALPYGCQVATLLWTWWELRRAGQELQRTERMSSRAGRALVLAGALSSLTIWSSPMSALFLVPVIIVEILALHRGQVPMRRRLWLVAPLVAGGFSELVIRRIHAAAPRRIESFQLLSLNIDWNHLSDNVKNCSANVLDASMRSVVLGALALNIVLLTRKPARPVGRRLLSLSTTFFMIWMISLAFPILLDYVRVNCFAPRYFALTHFLGAMAAGTVLLIVVDAALSERWRAIVVPLLAAAATVAALMAPRTTPSEQLKLYARVSEALAQRAPGEVLFGGYWGTYMLVDGTVAKPLVPVITDRQLNRIPWTRARFQNAQSVLVSHYESDQFGPGTSPFPYVYQHGTLLHLETAGWMQDGPISISRYRNVTSQTAADVTIESQITVRSTPCESEACVPIGQRNPGEEALRVTFPPVKEGRLVILFGTVNEPPPQAPSITFAAIKASSTTVVAQATPPRLHIESTGPMLIADFSSDAPVSGWRVLTDTNGGAQDVPNARAAFLLPRDESTAAP